MDKPKFNLDAHSILLLCNGEQVDTEAGKLQLTIVEQAEQVKPVIDLYKDSWGVFNDASQRFKDTVVKWLNEETRTRLLGLNSNMYYGFSTLNQFGSSPYLSDFTYILTIDEFCALAYPKEKESELVGKWLRYKREGFDTTNKWFEIKDVKPSLGMYLDSTNALTIDIDKVPFGDACFDLANPLDYNPETLLGKYYEGNKIESIYFDDDEAMIPRFKLSNGLAVLCKIVTPSDVTTAVMSSLPSSNEVLQTFHQAERALLRMAPSGENPNAEEVYACLELMRNWLLGNEIAQRAYEANKEIFHDYFGINE